nr:hypothetical protein GCM10017611_23010 [Rhodococcus wratislaviensis]
MTDSPTTKPPLAFDMIVASVGPYALNIRRPGAHRATNSGGHASPATTKAPNAPTAAGSTDDNAVGVNTACVTDSPTKIRANSSPP